MNYGDMLEQVQVCQRMQRADWQARDQYVFSIPGELLAPVVQGHIHDESPVVTSLWIKTSKGQIGPYTANNCDQMAEDWQYYTPPLPRVPNPSKGNQEDAKVVKVEEKKH